MLVRGLCIHCNAVFVIESDLKLKIWDIIEWQCEECNKTGEEPKNKIEIIEILKK